MEQLPGEFLRHGSFALLRLFHWPPLNQRTEELGYEWLVKEWIEPVVLPGSHMRLPMCIRYLGSVQAKHTHTHIQIIYLHAMVRYIYIRTHEIRESCIEMTFATLHSETVLLATVFFSCFGLRA